MEDILTAKNLSIEFENKQIFKDVNFSLPQGSMTALLGPNGSGKTTLTRMIMGVLAPSTGFIRLADNKKLGYVPQFRNLDDDYPLSIRAFIELNTPRFKTRAIKDNVNKILRETNLTALSNTRMGSASGGQKQRAYLAQALLDNPDLIILDEATASLDPVAKEELMSLLKHLNDQHGVTVLFTTHDLNLAKKYMENYLLFRGGQLISGKMADLTLEAYE